MLIEFRVSNFRSFNEEQVLSLVAARKDSKHPDSLIPCNGFDLLKSAVVYGANAAGKSNLVKAIGMMRWIVCNSATRLNHGVPIPGISPFLFSKDTTEAPTTFEVTLRIDEARFTYGFSATQERVLGEWLSAYPRGGREQKWFQRFHNLETKSTEWKFRGPLEKENKNIRDALQNTRDNCLLLSYAAQLNVQSLLRLYLWFSNGLWVFDLSDQPVALHYGTTVRLRDNKAFHDRVVKLIHDADLGIDDIQILEEPVRVNLPAAFMNHISEEGLRVLATGKTLTPIALHGISLLDLSGNCPGRLDTPVILNMLEHESNGTNRFFALIGPCLDALDKGTVVVVDELECSMHPLLTRKLIELFQSPEENKKGAQLIFATHDVSLMAPDLLRRDQIWIVEKRESGASVLFSLYDFETKDRPRNTESFQRNYLAGRYGGVPKFGPALEDLETR